MTLKQHIFEKSVVLSVFLILAIGTIVYVNTLQAPFTFDDEWTIAKNPVIRKLENFYANKIGYEFLPNRYIATLSLAVNYHFGGLKVTGYHAVNLLIHLLSALLVYALPRLTFRTTLFQNYGSRITDYGSRKDSSLLTPHVFIPLFAALLFVIHPVQTQAVTYIVQRMTSLAAMFYLLSLVLYVLARLRMEQNSTISIQHSERKSGSRITDHGSRITIPAFSSKVLLLYIGSVLAALLAMKSKEIAFTLPLAALLYEASFFRGAWKRRLLYLLPLLATLPIVPLTVLGLGGFSGDILSDSGRDLPIGTAIPQPEYLLTQFRVMVTYLRLLILPVNQNLDYDYPVYTTFLTPPVFLSFLLLSTIFILAIYLFLKTRPTIANEKVVGSRITDHGSQIFSAPEFRLISFGILWFFLTLSLESSLVPLQDVIMEHRLYLPSFGAATAFATAFCLLALQFPKPAFVRLVALVAIMVVVGLGYATFQRNRLWSNSVRLWQDVAEKSPNKARVLNNLGVALENAGRRPEAISILSRAIEIDPGYFKSYYNLGDLYLVSGQPGLSLPLMQTAIQLNPTFPDAYVGVGAALMRSGRYRDVTVFLEENLDRIRGNAEAHFYLGASYAFLGNRQAALRELAIVSQLDPELSASLRGLLR